MSFVVEDGYNTTYISTLLTALFHKPSIIDRVLLLDNNSHKLAGILLQRTIEKYYVTSFRYGTSITSKALNQIRNCACISGWKNTNNIDDMCNEYNPIELYEFIASLIEVIPIDLSNKKTFVIDLPNIKNTVQESFNLWQVNNTIINIPQVVIFNIKQPTQVFNINKKIRLFQKEHDYHRIKWKFHAIICCQNEIYKTIITIDHNLFMFSPNTYPCLSKIESIQKNKYDKLYIIYTKEPMI